MNQWVELTNPFYRPERPDDYENLDDEAREAYDEGQDETQAYRLGAAGIRPKPEQNAHVAEPLRSILNIWNGEPR